MTNEDRRNKLIQNTLEIVRREAEFSKDAFTTQYLRARAVQLQSGSAEGAGKAQLSSARNLIAKLADAVDGRTTYDDASGRLYKAAVEDLRDELDAACEGREDFW